VYSNTISIDSSQPVDSAVVLLSLSEPSWWCGDTWKIPAPSDIFTGLEIRLVGEKTWKPGKKAKTET